MIRGIWFRTNTWGVGKLFQGLGLLGRLCGQDFDQILHVSNENGMPGIKFGREAGEFFLLSFSRRWESYSDQIHF